MIWISISLSNDYYAVYKVKLSVVDIPEGYAVGDGLPEYAEIKLKAKGWKLSGLDITGDIHYAVSAQNERGNVSLNLYSNVLMNPWISNDISLIEILPDSVHFNVEKIKSKQIPIKADLDLKFKSGYGLASPIKLVPDSVTVYGPESVIVRLDSFRTENIKLSNLDSPTEFQLGFASRFTTDFKKVKIELDVQRIVDKEISGILIEVKDIPPDRNVLLIPNSVTVLIKGGINTIGKLNETELSAYVHYKDVLLDTLGSIKPHIIHPENLKINTIKPERLRYVIKKFN